MAKQHTFDDFAAAGRLLVEKGYATRIGLR